MAVRILSIPLVQRLWCRQISLKAELLTQRSVISLSGKDVYSFMQGLITNDANILNENRRTLFTLLLNTKGRILYDVLLYWKSTDEMFVECDTSCRNDLLKHLKQYRIRKKVEFNLLSDDIWVLYNFDEDDKKLFQSSDVACVEKLSYWKAKTAKYEQNYKKVFDKLMEENCLSFRDPRSLLFGFRVITPADVDLSEILSCFEGIKSESDKFRIRRYRLGIAEGVKELPPGNCFPLEANADYLGGVSFNKGCYIGQELTARTYHTGVIRKRMMPIVFSTIPPFQDDGELVVTTKDGKSIGKLRGMCGKYGVALLRITDALQNHSDLMIGDVSVTTYKPFWWPEV